MEIAWHHLLIIGNTENTATEVAKIFKISKYTQVVVTFILCFIYSLYDLTVTHTVSNIVYSISVLGFKVLIHMCVYVYIYVCVSDYALST